MRAILSKFWQNKVSLDEVISEILGDSYKTLEQTEDGQNKISNLKQAIQWWKEKTITIGELEEITETELERLN